MFHFLISEKLSLIEETGVVSSLICYECEQTHDARVVYEGSQYGYYCPDLGFILQPRAELITAQPDVGAFIARIADAFPSQTHDQRLDQTLQQRAPPHGPRQTII
jgi:hypothetical protein